jgi:hypothetical protein
MQAEHRNLGGPHFKASASAELVFYTGPQIPGQGLIWGLGWSCSHSKKRTSPNWSSVFDPKSNENLGSYKSKDFHFSFSPRRRPL